MGQVLASSHSYITVLNYKTTVFPSQSVDYQDAVSLCTKKEALDADYVTLIVTYPKK